MGDLPYVQRDNEVQIVGQDSSGNQVNYVTADVNGNMAVKDYSDGPVTPGTAASVSSLAGGQFNTSLPTLTTGQQSAIQLDSSGRILVNDSNFPTTVDTNYGTVGASTLRTASQIGNATGAADFGAGATDAQVLRVVLPTDQTGINTFLDKAGTGTITALNQSVTATTNGCSTVVFNITGTWIATLSFQATVDGTTWETVNGNLLGLDISTQFVSTNTFLAIPCGGFSEVRLNATAFTSGTADIAWNAGAGITVLSVFNNVAAAFNAQVVGNVASGTADSGNPVKVGAVYNSTLPAPTSGERVDNQANQFGELAVRSRNKYKNLTGNATTTVKSGAGVLHGVSINNPLSTGGTATIYDNTAGSGTIIMTLTLASSGNSQNPTVLIVDAEFTTGLTVVLAGSTTNNFTFFYY